MQKLIGIHAVSEALRSGRPIERVSVLRTSRNARLEQIVALCREQKAPLRFETREALDRLAGAAGHQGVVALAAEQGYLTLAEVLARAGRPGLLVAADGIEDPHNLGAIIRSASAAGAHGLLLPERRSAGLGETVAKAAAGALEHLPVARVKNLNRALDELKRQNYWLFGLDERGDIGYHQAGLAGDTVLVLGGEGKGLHEHTARRCDFLLKIPTAGPIGTLNVSVAAGIVLFEAARQRREKQQPRG